MGHIDARELEQPDMLYDRLRHVRIKGEPNPIELPPYRIFETECYLLRADDSIRQPEAVLAEKLRNKFWLTKPAVDCHQPQDSKPEEPKGSRFIFDKLSGSPDTERLEVARQGEQIRLDQGTIDAINRSRERAGLVEKDRVAPATEELA